MSASEYVMIPKENYVEGKPRAIKLVDDPTLTQEAPYVTLLRHEFCADTNAEKLVAITITNLK